MRIINLLDKGVVLVKGERELILTPSKDRLNVSHYHESRGHLDIHGIGSFPLSKPYYREISQLPEYANNTIYLVSNEYFDAYCCIGISNGSKLCKPGKIIRETSDLIYLESLVI